MGIMITCHRYNNGYNNPMHNAHKNVGAHYAQKNMVITSQRPHLQISSHWRLDFNIWIWEETQIFHSQQMGIWRQGAGWNQELGMRTGLEVDKKQNKVLCDLRHPSIVLDTVAPSPIEGMCGAQVSSRKVWLPRDAGLYQSISRKRRAAAPSQITSPWNFKLIYWGVLPFRNSISWPSWCNYNNNPLEAILFQISPPVAWR